MTEREQIIKSYFQCWIDKNDKILHEIFDSKVIYSECYGPKYYGIDSIKRWFEDWNNRGKVLVWDITQFIHQKNKTVVEWYFKCKYEGNIGEFDGVSLIEFNDNNQLMLVKEFQSKIPHYDPYK